LGFLVAIRPLRVAREGESPPLTIASGANYSANRFTFEEEYSNLTFDGEASSLISFTSAKSPEKLP
jgi:hypothetical protein